MIKFFFETKPNRFISANAYHILGMKTPILSIVKVNMAKAEIKEEDCRVTDAETGLSIHLGYLKGKGVDLSTVNYVVSVDKPEQSEKVA